MQDNTDDTLEEEFSGDVFADYICRSDARKYGSEHPAPISEAASLGAISLPKTNYPLWDTLLENGPVQKLSSLQLEGVLYACAKHQEILPDGNRCGFFIGDGAGVGKGRQIASIIYDNYARGRTKHLWVSTSADLHLEAQRDLHDIGSSIPVINGFKELFRRRQKKLVFTEKAQQGVLFLTYTALTSKAEGRRRLDQVLEWLGGDDFDGCLCFDECHKAKNFVPGSAVKQTKIAATAIELQERVPLARVLYCSATGVSGVGHMAYVQRLGLWGPSTAFHDFKSFYGLMKRRGVAFLEMLAMELKAEGKYIARSLSFKGTEFEVVKKVLKPEQVEVYNAAAEFWLHLQKQLERALSLVDASRPRDVWCSYWSTHQRFFRHLCVALKVPFVVEMVEQRLREGCAIVIGVQSTGEAALQASELTDDKCPTLISTARVMLRHFINQHFPIVPQTSVQDTQHAGAQECLRMKHDLLEELENLALPFDFLDVLIEELGGPEHVAEMTGRRCRLEREPDGQYGIKQRSRGKENVDSINVCERQRFMSGKKLIGIISDAGSTGISLHADQKCQNQRRRVHITIELPWAADKAIQQLGRTHRSNQITAPIYQLVCTNVGGEQRFLSAVAKRLESLGALTRGDRRAASGVDLSENHFDTEYGRISLKRMYRHIATESPELPAGVTLEDILQNRSFVEAMNVDCDPGQEIREMHTILGVYLSEIVVLNESTNKKRKAENLPLGTDGVENSDVRRFFNRLLGLTVEIQSLLFNYFSATLKAAISAAKTEGLYIEGVSDVRGQSISRSAAPEDFWIDPATKLATVKNEITIDRGISFDDALDLLTREGRPNDDSGFYRSLHRNFGHHSYILAIEQSAHRGLMRIYKPNIGALNKGMEIETLCENYVRIDASHAMFEWQHKYETSLEQCQHGIDCIIGLHCRVGKRLTTMTVLSGSVVRIWGVLENVLQRYASGLRKSDSILKIVRVPLKTEGHLIGVKYPEQLLTQVVHALSMKEQHDADRKERLSFSIDLDLLQTPTPVLLDMQQRLILKDPPKTLLDYFPKRKAEQTEGSYPRKRALVAEEC